MKLRTVIGTVGLLLSAAILGIGIFAFTNHLLNKNSSQSGCTKTGKNIVISIKNDSFSSKQINGNLCDTLTITNNDDKIRNIAFGEKDDHVAYDGVTEKLLKNGTSFTVTLNQVGTFEVHDHLQDETQAFFTVSK